MVFLALGLALLSSWATSRLPPPEASTSLWPATLVFGQFFLFVLALRSMGSWLSERFLLRPKTRIEEEFLNLALGSVLAYLVAHFLTPLGLFQSRFSGMLWVLVGSALFLKKKNLHSFSRSELWFISAPALLVILKTLESLPLSEHGDAYITYLPAPRIWAETGGFGPFLQSTQFFLSTSWESLFAWGTALMGLQGGRGFEASQWFSQWTISTLALPGIALGLVSQVQRLPSRIQSAAHPMVWSCVVLAAIQVPSLRWMENLAKNDLGACFWALCGFHLLTADSLLSTRSYLLAGVVMGAATIAKLSLVPYAAVFGLGLLLSRGALPLRAKICLGLVIGGVLGALPILLRNGWLTSNPFYPWLQSWFPHSTQLVPQGLSEHRATAHATQLGFSWNSLPHYLVEILKEIRLLPALVLGLGWIRELRRPIFLSLAAAVLFTLVLRPSTEIRYQGVTLILLAFFSGVSALWALSRFSRKLTGVLALFLIASSNLSLFTLLQLGSPKFATFPTRSEALADTGGPAKLWIRRNLPSENSILVMGDGYPYYLLDRPITQYSRVPGLEELVAERKISELLKQLESIPFDFVYLSSRADFVGYRESIAAVMGAARSVWKSGCLRYSTPDAQVWDLRCLR